MGGPSPRTAPMRKKIVRFPTHRHLYKANFVPNHQILLIILNIKQLTKLYLEIWTPITLFMKNISEKA